MAAVSIGMERSSGLRRAFTFLGHIELIVAVTAFATGVFISGVQILLRYTTDVSIWWGQEASLLLMITSYFVGAAFVFRLRAYVVVDFFMGILPLRAQIYGYILAQMASLVFWTIVFWELIWMSPDALRTSTPVMRMPEFYFNLPLLYSSASIALTTAYVLARSRADPMRNFKNIDDLESRMAIPTPRSAAL
jgi:TRAP-type C4-dicarboxylate transport system permease small subunit